MHELTDDRGSVIAEQLMTMILVVMIALGVLQLALAVHVRNTLIEAAAEGARLAARPDTSLDDGVVRAESIAGDALGGLSTAGVAGESHSAGLDLVTVTLTAPVPLVGLWGPGEMTVRGSALMEPDIG